MHWEQIGNRQPWAHVARHSWGAGRPILHDHDYAEVCLVESGKMLEHGRGGAIPLGSGDLLLIEPRHVHCMSGVGDPDVWQGREAATGRFVNLAFPVTALDDLRRTQPLCPWQGGDAPRRVTLAPARSRELSALIDMLAASPGERLDLDCFLLALTRLLRDQCDAVSVRRIPGWLGEAVRRFEADPQLLRAGLPALTALGGRGTDHLNRSIHAAFGENATAFVNRRRIEHAVGMIEQGRLPIPAIAAVIGMPISATSTAGSGVCTADHRGNSNLNGRRCCWRCRFRYRRSIYPWSDYRT